MCPVVGMAHGFPILQWRQMRKILITLLYNGRSNGYMALIINPLVGNNGPKLD